MKQKRKQRKKHGFDFCYNLFSLKREMNFETRRRKIVTVLWLRNYWLHSHIFLCVNTFYYNVRLSISDEWKLVEGISASLLYSTYERIYIQIVCGWNNVNKNMYKLYILMIIFRNELTSRIFIKLSGSIFIGWEFYR